MGEGDDRIVKRSDILSIRPLRIGAGRLREDVSARRGEVEALAIERLDLVLHHIDILQCRDRNRAAIVHRKSPVPSTLACPRGKATVHPAKM
jgi:hypothetical protein